MLVQRNTFIPKRGQQTHVVELIKKGEVFVPFQVPYRISVPSIGPFDAVVFELEFKDLAEHERFWKGFNESVPESFWHDWFAATENGGSNEIWQIVG